MAFRHKEPKPVPPSHRCEPPADLFGPAGARFVDLCDDDIDYGVGSIWQCDVCSSFFELRSYVSAYDDGDSLGVWRRIRSGRATRLLHRTLPDY